MVTEISKHSAVNLAALFCLHMTPDNRHAMQVVSLLVLAALLPSSLAIGECSNYKSLNDADRSMKNNQNTVKCDSNFQQSAWYRFSGQAGSMMPTSCVSTYKCGTHAPGWLQGRHPTQYEGAIQAKVCFHWSSNCCLWSKDIKVRNCGSFYVYQLGPPPNCNLRYCGNGEQSPVPGPGPVIPPGPAPGSVSAPECNTQNFLEDADRSMTYVSKNTKCDSSLQPSTWYRFRGSAGSMMPTTCVPTYRCDTHAPGWLQGRHPTQYEGAIQAKVCFHWSSNCCLWSKDIKVRNCGSFYVYQLGPPPNCNLRYCGDGKPGPGSGPGPVIPPGPVAVSAPECNTQNFLEDADRSMTYSSQNTFKCDSNLGQSTWYRFRGSAGTKMPTACVPTYKCGTHAPGWLQGRHPTHSEGVIQAKVCFHWNMNCCVWSKDIKVRNCGGSFYVYQLGPAPTCNLRYCGDGAQGPGPGPVVPPGPGPVAPSGNIECGTKAQGSRIVGGEMARPGAWPWQAQIDYKKHPAKHWCGGSIVSPQWIVSAAHCFNDKDIKQYTLVAGEHDLNSNEGFEQNVPIQQIITHPNYAGATHDYDIALIKLQSPLNYNNRVRPVCLPQINFPENTNCYVTGWGATSEGGGSPAILRQARVPLVSRNTCQAGYPGYNITPRMLCAGYSKGGIDACQGDSGGPLVCPSGGKWYLAGAVSWGVGCARKDKYGVYADVLNLKQWVENTMNAN